MYLSVSCQKPPPLSSYCAGLYHVPSMHHSFCRKLVTNLFQGSIITTRLSHLNYSLESHTSLPGPLKGLSFSHRTAPALPRGSAACPTHLKYLSAPKVSECSPPLRWLGILSCNPAHFTQIPPLFPLETSHKRVLWTYWILSTRSLSNSVCGSVALQNECLLRYLHTHCPVVPQRCIGTSA